ncbi:MAG: hypothetical protein ABFE07_10225 [Armatimonadia bacterium]|nr:hypothetical protein [Planctomycetaceae bacterium]
MRRSLTTAIPTLILLAVLAMGAALTSIPPIQDQETWYLMRAVSANDTALGVTTNNWTTVGVNASGLFVSIPSGWTWVRFGAIVYGDGDGAGDPHNGTFTYKALAVHRGGPAETVCTGTMTGGNLRLSHYPYGNVDAVSDAASTKWIEGPPTCTDYWPTAAMVAGTGDDVGSVSFATNGAMAFGVEVTAITNLTTVYLVYTGGR